MQLLCHPLCPHSRFVRLIAGETGLTLETVDERPWERRPDFLALNPAGTTPVLIDGERAVAGGWVIAEYLSDAQLGGALMPASPAERAETRRLLDWFLVKMHDEAIRHLVHEKVEKRFMPAEAGGGAPAPAQLRVARANLKHHLAYVGHLARRRNWLSGDALSLADLAAAAQLSTADYLGDVPWDADESAKLWYARIKSRPSFRPLLSERVAGIRPPAHYPDPDF